jgi:preflagellin peptidase FlaK
MTMLGSASIFDIRRREVSDLLWIIFGVMAFASYLIEFAYGGTIDLFAMTIPILITAAVSVVIYKCGIFGGADALGLLTLAFIMPTIDGELLNMIFTLGWNASLVHPVLPLIVLSNAVILSLSQIGFNLVGNLIYALKNPGRLFEGLEHESIGRKILATAIGHRAISTPGYAFSIEQTIEGRRQFTFALGNVETADYEKRLNVWVTRGTPFLLFMAAGFICMLFVGDIASYVFGWFL